MIEVKILENGTVDRSGQDKFITETAACEVCGPGKAVFFKKVKAHYSNHTFSIEKCTGCGLVFVNPRLSKEFRDFCYKNEKHLVEWFLGAKDYSIQYANFVMDIFAKNNIKGGELLEIGAGIGVFMDIATENGFKCTGLELNDLTAQYAQKKYKVYITDFYELDLPDNSFDVIYMNHVLEHLGDPLVALKKCYQLLKPGGCIFIGIPRVDWLNLMLDKIRKDPELWTPEDHLYYYTPPVIKSLFKNSGLTQQTIKGLDIKKRIKHQAGISNGVFLAKKVVK